MSDKVLVDTSVWISFFRHRDSEVSTMLKQLLRTGRPVYTGIIATELFRGARSEKENSVLEELLSSLECLETKEEHFRGAGDLGYTLSQHGFTIGTVDLLIARIALANNAAVFTLDTHFTTIARHAPLRLYH